MPKVKKAQQAIATEEKIIAYKGFNEDLTCRPNGIVFQYEIGQTYRHEGEVEACQTGFHACEHPLDVFSYYPPANNRFALVELGGAMAREKGGDSKIAAAEITIKAEIRLPELIQAAVKYVLDRVKWIDGNHASGEREAVKNGDTGGAATASGDQGAATASGDQGAATASGDWGAATASGAGGAATASGNRGAATASGEQAIAMASGPGGKARGAEGCDLVLREFNDDGKVIARWIGTVGQDGIKPMTWYRLAEGKPVEVAEVD